MHNGVPFEVYLTDNDIVSHTGAMNQAARCSHLVDSDKVNWVGNGSPSHAMCDMNAEVGCPWGSHGQTTLKP